MKKKTKIAIVKKFNRKNGEGIVTVNGEEFPLYYDDGSVARGISFLISLYGYKPIQLKTPEVGDILYLEIDDKENITRWVYKGEYDKYINLSAENTLVNA